MPFDPGFRLRDPPRNSTSGIGARTMRGPTSAYLAGRRSCHTLGGSTTWSSTEMISGSGSDMEFERSRELTDRQVPLPAAATTAPAPTAAASIVHRHAAIGA